MEFKREDLKTHEIGFKQADQMSKDMLTKRLSRLPQQKQVLEGMPIFYPQKEKINKSF